MKIGIIGDTHFGAGYNLGKIDPKTQLNTRLLDFSNTFNRIIDEFEKRGVSLVVLTGDIFETRHPTSAQLNAFMSCIQRAVDKDLDIVAVVGNHDQQRVISTTTIDIFDFFDDISIYSDMGVYTVRDKHGEKIHLFLMPYRDRRMIGTSTNTEAIEQINNELHALAKKVGEGKKIVVGHMMLDKDIGNEIPPDTFSINELILPLNMFDGFDAVVMGHVHKHDIVSEKDPIIIYSGSMEKTSFGEKHHSKVAIVIETDPMSYEIIKTNVRCLYELNFDYTEADKLYGNSITDKMIEDIEKFNKRRNLTNAIVKFVAKVNVNDLYYVNQQKIRENLLSKNVRYLASLQVTSIAHRQLRNRNITEDISGKKAMASFIDGLLEPDPVKTRLRKYANKIITDVEGK